MAHDLDRRLLERTIELATARGGFSPRALRAALDSSPLGGAGRVEDPYNLLGHALRTALGVIARQQGRGLADLAAEAGVPVLGDTSLKAALDLDWDDPDARSQALVTVLGLLERVATWLDAQAPLAESRAQPRLLANRAAAQQVVTQDVVPTAAGPVLRQGVAKARRISIEDAEMRHGRKSRHQRHVLRDLDSGLVRAVGVTAANVPEAQVTEAVAAELAHQPVALTELHIDRAYLSSHLVRERAADLTVYCKAWPVRNGDRFAKTAFQLDWDAGTLRCPHDVRMPFQPGGVAHFPAEDCAACPLQAQCTTSSQGRSVSIHRDERLLAELRERHTTPVGRAKLRERVAVEHSLAHVGHWQGGRAHYRGTRKTLFDLRRTAVIHNLPIIARYPDQPAA